MKRNTGILQNIFLILNENDYPHQDLPEKRSRNPNGLSNLFNLWCNSKLKEKVWNHFYKWCLSFKIYHNSKGRCFCWNCSSLNSEGSYLECVKILNLLLLILCVCVLEINISTSCHIYSFLINHTWETYTTGYLNIQLIHFSLFICVKQHHWTFRHPTAADWIVEININW